ncbi:2797_t:CDS:2, partial [Gigaspora rosea]
MDYVRRSDQEIFTTIKLHAGARRFNNFLNNYIRGVLSCDSTFGGRPGELNLLYAEYVV